MYMDYVQPPVQPLANWVQKGYNIPDGAAMPLCRCSLTFVGVQRLPPLYTAVVLFSVAIIAYVWTHINLAFSLNNRSCFCAMCEDTYC